MFFIIFASILVLGFSEADSNLFTDKTTSDLRSMLASGGKTNIIVSFVAGTDSVLQGMQFKAFTNREAHINALREDLVQNAENSQTSVTKMINVKGTVQYKRFWITNQIFVKSADLDLVQAIAEDPQVSSIDVEYIAQLMKPVVVNNATLVNGIQWGIKKIQAPQAWEELGQQNGNGVVLATIDTGVRGTHEALRDNFLGEYGWYDPIYYESKPTDVDGHGSHTMGTIAGSHGIGVAPGAKWASCRGCDSFGCSQSDLLACGQFFLCPTLVDGSNSDCSKAPHLVSNSWGGGQGRTWFNQVIEAWHVAGIIPVFSAGNSGPGCGTSNSHGDQNVIAVGATTMSDGISYFSSLGPTVDGKMKPDVVAPGSDVLSAYHTSDTAYAHISGTSMSAPHAAGTVALLLTRNKMLTCSQVKQLLFENADKKLEFSGKVCGGIPDNIFPNHVFGHGRINALRSIRAQTQALQN